MKTIVIHPTGKTNIAEFLKLADKCVGFITVEATDYKKANDR